MQQGMMFPIKEYYKDKLWTSFSHEQNIVRKQFVVNFIAGGIAGAISTSLLYPLSNSFIITCIHHLIIWNPLLESS